MLLKAFVVGGPLLYWFWTLCSNFRVKGGGGGGVAWALDTYTTVCIFHTPNVQQHVSTRQSTTRACFRIPTLNLAMFTALEIKIMKIPV